MSDFTSDFWHLYVAVLTLVSIVACAVLLWVSGTTKVKARDDNTTGHVWDEDLRELNNPLPKWSTTSPHAWRLRATKAC